MEQHLVKCKLTLRTRVGFCKLGSLSRHIDFTNPQGFKLNPRFHLLIKPYECKRAFETGILIFSLGNQTLYLDTTKNKDNKAEHTGTLEINTYLSGSNLFQNLTCIGAQTQVFESIEKPLQPGKGKIINLTGNFEISKEITIFDRKQEMYLIPRLGLKFKTKINPPEYQTKTSTFVSTESWNTKEEGLYNKLVTGNM